MPLLCREEFRRRNSERTLTERFEEQQPRAETRIEQLLGRFEGLCLRSPCETEEEEEEERHTAPWWTGAPWGGAVGIPEGTGRGSAAGNLPETVGHSARHSGRASGAGPKGACSAAAQGV